MLGHGRTPHLWKHFLILGPETGGFWWLKKVKYLQKVYHCQLRGKHPKWIFHNFCNLLRPLQSIPASRERVVPTEWQVRIIHGVCISNARVIAVRAPQYRQHALISDLLDLANLSVEEEAALATNWIDDRPEGLKLQNLELATMTGPVLSSLQNFDCRRAVRHWQKQVFGIRATIDPSREFIGNCKGFLPVFGSPSTSFLAECVPVLCATSGHSWWRFWHLCSQQWIHCLGALLKNPFKTNWRESLSCSPIWLLQHRIWPAWVDNGCVLEGRFGT